MQHSSTSVEASKRDKKRLQISARLAKLDHTLFTERDHFYRNLLHELQTKLATLQQGTNPEFCRYRSRLEVSRDYELTKLRLWEQYQVAGTRREHALDVACARQNYNNIVRLIKEKLKLKLEAQVRKIKEEKLLFNLVSANSWSDARDEGSAPDEGVLAEAASAAAAAAALNAVAVESNIHLAQDRRSLRRREHSSRFPPGDGDDHSDTGHHSGTGTDRNKQISASVLYDATTREATHNNGYVSSNKRRRFFATRYLLNDELSGMTTGTQAPGVKNGRGKGSTHGNAAGAGRNGNDSSWSDKDYDTLSVMIMDPTEGSPFLLFGEPQYTTRQGTRGLGKQFTGVQGLKPEELNEDLELIKNASKNTTRYLPK